MKEELMRRISTALDGDGIASDPELQKELRADPDAAKYAKDLTRVNKWLATWPLPEPDEAAFEALAARIDQRMDEALPVIGDVAGPPLFEDDDALRDATAGLLESGEYRVDEIVTDPIAETSAASKPASPIARVLLEKKPVRGAVEEASEGSTGEPLSAADLELRLSQDPKPKRKKKGKPVDTTDELEAAAPAAASAAPAKAKTPALRVVTGAEPAKGKAKQSERVSIPSSPGVVAGSLTPVAELKPAKESRPSGAWWAFAAAACVGLGVFGAATMFEAGDAAPATTAAVAPASASTTLVPTAAPQREPAPPPPAPVVAQPVVAPDGPVGVAAAELAVPAEEPAPRADSEDLLGGVLAHQAARPAPTARGSASSSFAGDLDEQAEGSRHRRAPIVLSDPSASTAPSTAASGPSHADRAPTTTPSAPRVEAPRTTTTAPATPAPAPEPSPPADALPETPDRTTIQAVLEGVAPTVQACGGEEHGTADVDIVIAGSGRVTTATVHGPFAGTPTGSCIARAVRGARFPAFSQPRFQVTYPFHL